MPSSRTLALLQSKNSNYSFGETALLLKTTTTEELLAKTLLLSIEKSLIAKTSHLITFLAVRLLIRLLINIRVGVMNRKGSHVLELALVTGKELAAAGDGGLNLTLLRS